MSSVPISTVKINHSAEELAESWNPKERFHKSTGNFRSKNGGESIFFKRYTPKKHISSEKLIHLWFVHDIADYHGRYLDFVTYLLKMIPENIVVSLIDLKGHGMSSGSRAYIKSFDEYCFDFVDFVNSYPSTLPVSHNVFMGTGMGGLMTIKTIINFRSDLETTENLSMILTNPFIYPTFDLKKSSRRLLKYGKSLFSSSKFQLKSPIDVYNLTRDQNKMHEYMADQLVSSQISLSLINEIMKSSDQLRRFAYYIDIPSLFLISGETKLNCPSTTELFFQGIPTDDKKLSLYADGHHDILNDLNSEIVFNDIYNWLTELVRPKG
ncbi:MAG: hypothetical protein HOE90_08705 [Bacteriovoracaceae bacterium]|jgi:alpha-beta hydrolase superfamily lysophospholipase|nr:hypothetical protein [Bacteriovoracaceae bacterium]